MCDDFLAGNAARQAENQQRQDDRRHDDIDAISLQSERNERHRDTRHGRGDQQHQPELNDGAGVESERAAHDTADLPQLRRLTTKNAIVGLLEPVLCQVQYTANCRDDRRDYDADPQQITKYLIDLVIGQFAAPLGRSRRHIPPLMPLYSISSASTTTTPAKTRRRTFVFVFAST